MLIVLKLAVRWFPANAKTWPTVEARLQDGECPKLLHLRPSQKRRECRVLAELRSTRPITCSCPGAWRMSVVVPNSDVGTNSI